MSIKKWTLLKTQNISPSKWFPLEKRTYQLPNGKIVDDFYVTTIADVAMIVPVTKDERIVFVRQFKPGIGDVILEFPAGRIEDHHADIKETAFHELEEECGIKAKSLEYIGMFAAMPIKATEKIFCYLADKVEFNSTQKLDVNEDIEVIALSFREVEGIVNNNQLQIADTVATWDLAKRKFSHRFKSWGRNGVVKNRS